MRVTCPECETVLKVPSKMVGKKIRCSRCKAVWIAQEPEEEDDETPSHRKTLVLVGGGIGLVCLLGLIAGIMAPKGKPTTTVEAKPASQKVLDPILKDYLDEKPRGTVLSKDLLDDYGGNEIAADRDYKGSKIWLVGVVRSVQKGFTGKPVLLLDDGQIRIIGIRCEFPRDSHELDHLQAGKVIIVEGKVTSGSGLGVNFKGQRIVTQEYRDTLAKLVAEHK